MQERRRYCPLHTHTDTERDIGAVRAHDGTCMAVEKRFPCLTMTPVVTVVIQGWERGAEGISSVFHQKRDTSESRETEI